MKSRVRTLFLVVPFLLVHSLAQQPHFEHRKHLSEYRGPGADEPVPEDLSEVRIGYFGPSDPDHPIGGDLWLAANIALDEINDRGGYQGIPFKLVPGWSENPWGTGVSLVTKMVYVHQVRAIIGSIDGPSTHLAEQVVAKARVPLINPGSTDKTANLANVPWLFSCLPGEHVQVPLLAEALITHLGDSRFALVSSIDHDSRIFTHELTRYLSRLGRFPVLHVEYDSKHPNSLELLDNFSTKDIKAVIAIASPDDGLELIKAVRLWHEQVSIFGGPAFGRRYFLDQTSGLGEGIIFPYPGAIQDQDDSLSEIFRKKWNREPDFAARQTYDAIHLLAEAIRQVGLNRTRIRQALRQLSPWDGSNGVIEWDPLGQNRRPVNLATIRQGQVTAIPNRPD